MSEYKVGDRVLVEAVIVDMTRAGRYQLDLHFGVLPWINGSDIHGPAPKPPTDWSKVEFGARVRIENWEGRYLAYDPLGDDEFPHLVFYSNDGYPVADRFCKCELIEDES